MKKIGLLLACFTVLVAPATAEETPYNTEKKSCMMATGSMEETKAQLLLQAKREATGELFGELITSFSAVKDFELTADNMTASSAGFVRIKGSPTYSNGSNLGEVCVQIKAYVTEEDRNKFKPVSIANKQCASDSSLTVKAIKRHTEEQVIISSLYNYDRKLESHDKKQLLPLAHNVKYLESGFIPDTATYCAKYEGVIYPVEILALINATPSVKTEAIEAAASKSGISRPDPERKKRVYPKDQSEFLTQALGDTTRGGRFNSITQMSGKLNKPLSLKEMSVLMDGAAEYRANVIGVISSYLPAELTAKELKVLLNDETRGSRYNAIVSISSKLSKPVSQEEFSVLLEGIEEYRANAVGVIANHLPKNLNEKDLDILLADSTRGSRYNIIVSIEPKLAKSISLEELSVLLKGTDEYRANAVGVISSRLAKNLSVAELEVLLEGSSRGSRYSIISHIAKKLSKPVAQDSLLVLLEGIGEYRANAMQVINN